MTSNTNQAQSAVDQPNDSQADNGGPEKDFTETDILFFGCWVVIGEALKEVHDQDQVVEFFRSARGRRFLVGEITIYTDESDEDGHFLQAEVDFEKETGENRPEADLATSPVENIEPYDIFDIIWMQLGIRIQKEYSQEDLSSFLALVQAGLPIAGAIATYLNDEDEEGIVLAVKYSSNGDAVQLVNDVESEAELSDLDEE